MDPLHTIYEIWRILLNFIPFIHIYPEQLCIMEIFNGNSFFNMADYV